MGFHTTPNRQMSDSILGIFPTRIDIFEQKNDRFYIVKINTGKFMCYFLRLMKFLNTATSCIRI